MEPTDLVDPAGEHPEPVAPSLLPLGRHRARVPMPGRSALDDAAHLADRRRLAAVLRSLETRFDPLNAVLGSASRVVDPHTGDVVRTQVPISADAAADLLDRVLSFDDNRPPRLGFILDPAIAVDDQVRFRTGYDVYRPDVADIASKLEAGAGVAVAGIEGLDLRLLDLVEDLEFVLGGGVSVDLIVAAPGTAVPLPVAAARAWLLLPLDHPVRFRNASTSSRDLRPGTGVVVESSCVVEVSKKSILLRISLPRPTWGRSNELLVERARAHPIFRADLPTDLSDTVRSYGGSLADGPAALRRYLHELVDETLPSLIDGSARTRAPRATRSTLMDAIAVADGAERSVRFANGVLVVEPSPGDVQLVLGDHRLLTTDASAIGLASRFDGSWWPARRTLSTVGFDDRIVSDLLVSLLALGVVDVATHPEGSDG